MKRITKKDEINIKAKAQKIADESHSRTKACRMWAKARAQAEIEMVKKTLNERKQIEDEKLIGKWVTIISTETVNLDNSRRWADYCKMITTDDVKILKFTPNGARVMDKNGREFQAYNILGIVKN